MRIPTRLHGRAIGRPDGWSVAAVLLLAFLLVPLVLGWLPGGPAGPAAPGESAPVVWSSFAASLAVCVAAAALAVVVGCLLSAAVVLTDLPGRTVLATLLLLPFLCPPTVWTLGQVYCYGAGGLAERWFGDAWRAVRGFSDARHYLACTLVLAEIHAPLVMLIVGRGLGRLHHSGFEAARLSLRPAALIRWTAGAIRRELGVAFLLVLALDLGNFAVPHVLQCPLYPMEIYLRLANYLDPVAAFRAALPLVAFTLVAAGGMGWLERAGHDATAAPAGPRTPVRLRGRMGLAAVGVGGYFCVAVGLPLAAIIYECKSLNLFVKTVLDAAQEVQNTLLIGAQAAVIACLAGLVVGTWVARRGRLAANVLSILPIGVPAMVLALAYLRFYNRAWPVDLTWLGSTSALVVLALAARAWPFATRIAANGQRRVAREWHEAAELAGVRGGRRWWWITGPLLAPSVAAAAVVAFFLAVGDVEISQMLCAPGTGTLAVRLFTFLHFGPTHVAAGLALLELIIALIPAMAYFLWTNRWLPIV